MSARYHAGTFVRTIAVLLGMTAGCTNLSPTIWSEAIAAELLRGAFTNGVDHHEAHGTAIVSDAQDGAYEVRFNRFRVSQGPDLEVWLVAHANPRTNEDVLASHSMSLGSLKTGYGNHVYPIPAGTDLSKYQSVVIWCNSLDILFSPAVLR